MIEQPATNSKPALDEESFTRLLAAAYVMQEHQERVRAKLSPADLTEIIAQVVETQQQIRSHNLAGDAAFDLIATRLCSVTRAAGVAIATVNGDKLHYCAGTGSAAMLTGSEIAKQASLAAACLKTGTASQSPLAQTDPRLDPAQCRKVGAQSLLAVPLYHDRQVAGAIEVYFSQISGFTESETRAAELMAGVASEVLADAAEQELKEELESERASVLQALQVLEPELKKLAGEPLRSQTPPPSPKPTELCRACGHAFIGNETACGVCGASRATGMYPGAALQSKWAVLWEKHLTAEHDGIPRFRKTPLRDEAPALTPLPAARDGQPHGEDEPGSDGDTAAVASASAMQAQSATAIQLSPWKSVAEAQQWVDSFHSEKSWPASLRALRDHGGDASLAVAALILLITLVWAVWPRTNPSLANAQTAAIASVRRRPRPKPPKLTLFEEALVGLGLAVPPPTPEYLGDPNIKVWEDLQTALYYCPDADLYGVTAKGRYTTQAEAQQDAFEPASRKPCD